MAMVPVLAGMRRSANDRRDKDRQGQRRGDHSRHSKLSERSSHAAFISPTMTLYACLV